MLETGALTGTPSLEFNSDKSKLYGSWSKSKAVFVSFSLSNLAFLSSKELTHDTATLKILDSKFDSSDNYFIMALDDSNNTLIF